MKYLLPFLEGLPDGPNLSDPDFQKLLHDVQAGKASAKGASDAWYESLEKIIAELKSSPESVPFQKPVSKKEAPDYYLVITQPMDLQTISKNIKAQRYKSKADFVKDLELIWFNCAFYNTLETHPIRVQARYLKQKADHHLEFLADRNEGVAASLLPLPIPSEPSRNATAPLQPSPLRQSSQLPGGDEDAAGESDDGGGGGAEGGKDGGSFRGEAGAGPQSNTAANNVNASKETAGARSGSRDPAEGETSSAGGRAVIKQNGVGRSTTPFRPKLQTSLENAPAIVRTPYSMTHHLSISLAHAGPSTLTQGRAKELLQATPAPAWYAGATTTEDDELRYEGNWWGVMSRDESYAAGLPAVPSMLEPTSPRRARIARPRRSPKANGRANGDRHQADTPPLDPSKPLNLETVIHRSVDKLNEARKYQGLINDWQRIENEGGVLPNPRVMEMEEKFRAQEEKTHRKRVRKEGREEAKKRRKMGGEVGEEEAAKRMKLASAAMLAHEGFEGANEVALDMFTRVAADHIFNLGKTFRLLLDGFGNKMPPDEIILHALHENGQTQTSDLEAHVKDDIEREGSKIAEMARRMRQGYNEVTTAPAIEYDMLFEENEGMLTDGNFAEELGEDFLGLREMGIEREFGLSSLSVPTALFHGRRRRVANAEAVDSRENLAYPPPPPFIPLTQNAVLTHLPALLHAFYSARIESGKPLGEDDAFDPAHSQIGSLGQIVVKTQSAAAAQAAKRKKEAEAEARDGKVLEKKPKPKKAITPGVGKGNWVRPTKDEKEKKAAQKGEKEKARGNGSGKGDEDGDGQIVAYGDDDAEGEEE